MMDDRTLTFKNAQEFCRLLSNQLPDLKKVQFNIYDSYDGWTWRLSRIVDGENESTKHILNIIYCLVDHMQQLVSLYIDFIDFPRSEKPCFRHLIRQQLHQYPLNQPYRLRCSADSIQIWL